VRGDVRRGRQGGDLRDEVRGAYEVSYADAGGDRFGEGRRVDDLPALRFGEHRGQPLPGEAQLHVRVVLEDRELVLPREREQLGALRRAQGVTRGVLEIGDDV